MVCTGNTCRSPMAAALLARHLADAGLEAGVSSTGILFDGKPATDFGVAVMADREIDTSGHRSRKLRPEMVAGADIVIGMAREHLVEALALRRDTWEKAFTLKEIVRLGEEHGGREPGEPLSRWLVRLHEARLQAGVRMTDLLAPSADDDVADPIGGPRRSYQRTAEELDDLTARLARLLGKG
jgi:protein-tyrosine-phosphatase